MAYIKSHRNQNYLIPPKISDLFSENHVCYLIEQIADSVDYSKFDVQYSGPGGPAYHPRINIKLLMMANVDGIKSSRKIAKRAQQDAVYIYLSEKLIPNFRTISDFRKDNPEIVEELLFQLSMFAYENGLIDLSHLMIDGTTIKANANNDRVLDKETIGKLREYIEKQIKEGIKVDKEEDKIFGKRGLHQLPENLNDREKRRPIVMKMVEEINKAMQEDREEDVQQMKKDLNDLENKMEEKSLKKYSFTDPDSRFMLNKKGKVELSYNAQLIVENNGLIVANNVVQNAGDRNQLLPSIARVEKNFGQLHKGTKVSADEGYCNGKHMEILDYRGFDLYIPGKSSKPETRKNKFAKANFIYDEENDKFICPANKILNLKSKSKDKRYGYCLTYRCADCTTCDFKQACCKDKKSRTILATPYDKLFNRIKKKLKSPEGRATYKLRKQTVERSFGDIKHNKKFTNFLLRGVEKTKTEFNLVCLAHNLVMINNLMKKKRQRSETSPEFLAIAG